MFCCWPPSLSAKASGDSLRSPSLHPFCLSIPSILHRLPGSYAYLLIMLQGFSPHRDAFWGNGLTTQQSQIGHRWFISLALFKQAQMLRFFFSGPRLLTWSQSSFSWWTPGTVWASTQWAKMKNSYCARRILKHSASKKKASAASNTTTSSSSSRHILEQGEKLQHYNG